MSPAGSILGFRRMTRRFGELTAVDGLDLEIASGEMVGLIGPDGAGKTTSLRVALGLLKASAGEVETCGLDPVRSRGRLARRVGYLSQRFSLYGDLSVDENVEFFAQVHGVRDWRRRRQEMLDLVRLTPFRERLADRLSGGMKQKLALACTLIHTPELLVLDEPTTGVDPVSRRDFWRLLASLQAEGLTIFMTTPYLDEAERCQRVALLHRGSLLAVDEPRTLRERFPGSMLEVTARPRRRALEMARRLPEVSRAETFGERLHLHLPRIPPAEAGRAARRVAAELSSGELEVRGVRSVAPSLEDVFIHLVGETDA